MKKPKPEKLKEKEEKMKTKQKKLAQKLKGVTATVAAAATALAMMAAAGCQTADPSSRSNRAEYGDVAPRVEINGCSNVVSVTNIVGDGVYASADGGGDKQTNTPTQTTDTKPEVAVGVGGGSAGTGGASTQAGLTDKIMAALKATGLISAGNVNAAAKAVEAACSDGSCSPVSTAK